MQRKRQNMSMSTIIMTMTTKNMSITMKTMSMSITMTTKIMNIIMTMNMMRTVPVAAMIMRSMSITMSMMKTVPVAAMTMSTITIIMQMTYLPAGARRHRTNLSVQNLRKYLRSLSILTIFSAPKDGGEYRWHLAVL